MFQARYCLIGQPTGNDIVKRVEIKVHVQGTTMERNSLPHRDPHRAKLALLHPHARQPRPAHGRHGKTSTHPDQDLFETSDKASYPAGAQQGRKNGVRDELTRTVVGRPASTLDLDQGDTFLRQLRGRKPELLPQMAISQGHHRIMLGQHERIFSACPTARM